MTVLPICRLNKDSVLRQKVKMVSRINTSTQRQINNIRETIHWANGVGLAAPQVGVPLRVIVIQMPGEESIVLINPEIIKTTGEREVTEGCLSVPGYYGEIERSAGKITLTPLQPLPGKDDLQPILTCDQLSMCSKCSHCYYNLGPF